MSFPTTLALGQLWPWKGNPSEYSERHLRLDDDREMLPFHCDTLCNDASRAVDFVKCFLARIVGRLLCADIVQG